jgi:hypothetical protein
LARAPGNRRGAGKICRACPQTVSARAQKTLIADIDLRYRKRMNHRVAVSSVCAILPRASIMAREMTLAFSLAVLTVSCTQNVQRTPPPETKVDYQTLIDMNASRYELQPEETSNKPVAQAHPAPDYPSAMIALHLAQVTVRAKVIVDAEGHVSDVRIDHPAGLAGYPTAFDAAVRDGVRQWRYTPLQITRWEAVRDAHGNFVDSHAASVTAKPFSLDYAFHFELHDGKPAVSQQQQAPTVAR